MGTSRGTTREYPPQKPSSHLQGRSTHRTPLPTLAVTQPNEMSCVCWTCVPQGTIQVIQERGKFKKFADPGCHWVIPCLCQDVAGALSTRVQALDVAVETKTKDNVFVTIIVSTQYMVLRESSRMYDVFSTKEEIAIEVKNMLEKAMTEFGYTIIQTLV